VEPLALPIRARFVPFHGRPDCSSDWCIPRTPGGRFSAVLLATDGGLVFVRTRGRGRLPHRAHAIPSRAATEAVTGVRRPAAGEYKTGTAPW